MSLAWGIIGTGNIAKTFAKGVQASSTGTLVAIASRSLEKAEVFGADFLGAEAAQGVKRYGSYADLLTDPRVQAVYIATPHPHHAEWAIKAAEAGKHILCEKPITLNYAEAMQVVEAARANGVFLMEAYMYRCHPQTQRVIDLIKEKAIGEVRAIQATFSFHWPHPFNAESRLVNNALGGGVILDVGGYVTTFTRLIAGAALGADVAEPVEFKALGHVGTTGVDEYAVAVAKFPNDIVATLATGVQCNMDNVIRIFGSDGSIEVPSPWIPGNDVKIHLQRRGSEAEVIAVSTGGVNLYTLEADVVAHAVAAGKMQAAAPAMTWDDTLQNMRLLDGWRRQLGQQYESEKIGNLKPVISLAPAKNQVMTYGKIAGVSKPVSRLIFGVDKWDLSTAPHAFAMFDDFYARGGNTFDSAYIYAGGQCEKLLGAWLTSRKLREQVVLLTKGCHPPHCTPEALSRELKESLERQQTDYTDIYMMHRDNVDVPIGEFVDVMNEHKNAGRIHAFGGSNWTTARVDAFNADAAKKGLTGFAGVSNNFSLARMVNPVWAGCVAASDPATKAWFVQQQMPLLSWSSQARGFFTDRSGLEKTGDRELVNSWYSEDNFQRKARAVELAKKKNVTPIQIALAYVLAQDFPTFALIGPYSIGETWTSFDGLKVELTPGEVRWLNLESETI